MRSRIARTDRLPQSVFSEMTQLAEASGAVNLSQGFPDFPAPEAVKEAACRAIRDNENQYAPTPGLLALRESIARDAQRRHGLTVDPETDVTVCCGATEATLAAMLGLVEDGDEVVIFEPFYENYGPAAMFAGAAPRYVRLEPPDWTFDPAALEAAFSERTRAIVINTPNNPTGKVFTREELESIARLCRKHDVLAISDEIYEHLVYDGRRHVPIATLDGMAERTVTIGSLSKTFSLTGWRVGWAIASKALSAPIRKVHDYLTVAAPTPLQEAAVAALALPETYFSSLVRDFQNRRDLLTGILTRHGFACVPSEGAYFIMAGIEAFGATDDVEFARYLATEIGVASIPGSSFYARPPVPGPRPPAPGPRPPAPGLPRRSGLPPLAAKAGPRPQVRFCFCKQDDTIHAADRRLAALDVASGRR
jgi:aspartate/methionine/tyrosine aminotransferase